MTPTPTTAEAAAHATPLLSVSDVIQLLAVLVAIGASIVALVIASRDRKLQLKIAQRDRELARLTTELEYAVRLSTSENMGGSTDAQEVKRLGAERLALANVVGERWVPRLYARSMDYKTPDELRAVLDESDEEVAPWWFKEKVEAGLAVQAILAEMYARSTD